MLSQEKHSQATRQILLIGAGELGNALLTSLLTLPNHVITLGVRNPTKYVHLKSSNSGFDIVQLDLSSKSEQLMALFLDFDIIISATGFAQDTDAFMRLAQEVLKAGEERKKMGKGEIWYFPWQWGVNYDVTGDGDGLMPLFGVQKAIRDLLRQEASSKNVNWTVVSTGMFMSFLFEPFWGVVETSQGKDTGEPRITVRALRDWQHKVSVTDVKDIGRVLARILAGDMEASNRIVYVAGDTVSYADIANIVKGGANREIIREEWNISYLEGELRKDPENQIKKYRCVFAKEGVWWDKSKTVNHVLGMDMMDVKAYIQALWIK